jgi:hypothetical protein
MTGPLYALLPPADHTDADSDELLGRFLDYVSGKGLDLYPPRRRRSSSCSRARTSS